MLNFDPSSLSKYGRLTMVARNVVEGFLTGAHKSPYKGFSIEFAEHRQYTPGDEIRHIDWRAYGKTDRYYVKEYEDETNLRAHLLVDASGRNGLVSTKNLNNRKFNQSLKNVACWGYWKGTGVYSPQTPRRGSPYFEALTGMPFYIIITFVSVGS